jgi:DNA-directed RNA polymerase sigma subunit (sigma70/sigma32)
MTAAHIDGLIARGEKDGYLPFSEIEKMAGELNSEGLDVLNAELDLSLARVRAKLGIKLERVRQIEAVALERLSLERELQELHERTA